MAHNNRIERRERDKVPSSSMGARGAHAERWAPFHMESVPATRRPLVVTTGCDLTLLVIVVGLVSVAALSGMTVRLFTFFAISSLLPICASVGAYFARNWGGFCLGFFGSAELCLAYRRA